MQIEARLIARPHFLEKSFLPFLKSEGFSWKRTKTASDSEEITEAAGRVCYMSFGKNQSPRSNPEYIQNLIRMGHESVLEHVSWTFLLSGVSRGFSHQLVRHRVGFSFSQLSQQYHEESEARFVRPSMVGFSSSTHTAWNSAVAASKRAYKRILKDLESQRNPLGLSKREWRRAIRSAARSVLPNATETKIVMSANARALRYFLRVRGSILGDEEMRAVAAVLLRVLKVEAPSIFFDFSVRELLDGSPVVVWRDGTPRPK